MNQRTYNKIYVNVNRDEGSKDLLLGYKHDEKEITFKRDRETYFHVPLYSVPIELKNSDLIVSGAVGGPFPEASDRIFKNQKNYGNNTPYGTPTPTSDGLWFCSWLHLDPLTNNLQWLDRYYSPGRFSYEQAINELNLPPVYVPNKEIFYDTPTKLILEPGVLYKYFHCGEKLYQNLLKTYEGVNSEYLSLSLTNWLSSNEDIDSSANKTYVNVFSNTNQSNIVSSNSNVVDKQLPSTIDFDNNYETYVNASFADEYTTNISNEFTWSCWLYSEDWQSNASAQLIGNKTTKGGGISISLSNYQATPLTIVSESNYGHLLFINEKGEGFLDKGMQDNLLPVSAACIAIDGENNVIVCQSDSSGVIYKIDHSGDVINSTKNYADESTLFSFNFSDEVPQQVLCGKNNDIFVLTNKSLYSFDSNFSLIKNIAVNFNNTVAAFSYNTTQDSHRLELVDNVYDVKYIEQDRYSLSRTDGHLYKNDQLLMVIDGVGTNLAVAPDNKLWVLHNTNKCTIVNLEDLTKTFTIAIGSEVVKINAQRQKHINFINGFDRATNSRYFRAVIYYSDERILYYYNLEGVLILTNPINSLFNNYIVTNYQQQYEKFDFKTVGDFTGYEHKRVFSKLSPYNSKTRIELSVSLQNTSKPFKSFETFNATTSIDGWSDGSWQHLSLTFAGKKFSLYNNSNLISTIVVPGNYQLNYTNQPLFSIGSPTGSRVGFNREVRCTSNIFNGKIGDIKIYSYPMPFYVFNFFQRSIVISEDLVWHYPTPKTQYVEQIEQVYKHKVPGSKSQFFNLKLIGTQITDPAIRLIIEEEIRELITELKPLHTDLLKINWID